MKKAVYINIKYLVLIPVILLMTCQCSYLRSSEIQKVLVSDTADKLSRTQLFNDNLLYAISGLAYGELDPAEGPEIGIAAKGGIYFIDTEGNIKRKVQLSYEFMFAEAPEIAFIDLNNDNIPEYMIKGGPVVNAAVFNHDGSLIWRSEWEATVGDMDYGDVNNDGKMEFAAIFPFSKGLVLLDDKGGEIWSDESVKCGNVAVADINGDGTPEIIVSNFGEKIILYDKDGNIERTLDIRESYFGYRGGISTLVRWPDKASGLKILTREEKRIRINDFNGKLLFSVPADNVNAIIGTVKAVTVKLSKSEPEYLALLFYADFPSNAFLTVYDNNGHLIHSEDLADRPEPTMFRTIECGALGVMPSGDGTEALLVGQRSTVWKYELQSGLSKAIEDVTAPQKVKPTDIVKFPDKALELGIRRAILKPDGDIMVGDLAELAELEIQRLSTPSVADFTDLSNKKPIPIENPTVEHQKIKSLEGLQYCTNLFSIKLDRNEIVDLTPISKLTNLAKINFSDNLITDISPISGLNNLQNAYFRNNKIESLGEMKKLFNLTIIDLGENNLEDLSGLSGLPSLAVLLLDRNKISDLSPLSGLPLKELVISQNRIDDLSPLNSLSDVFIIHAEENQIKNVGNLENMTNLIILDLADNRITELKPFTQLPLIRALDLSNNLINDIKYISGMSFSEKDRFDYDRPRYSRSVERNPIPGVSGGAIYISHKALFLFDNRIEDLSPFLKMSVLDKKLEIGIEGNPLNDDSVNNVIPALRQKGVEIRTGKTW